MNEKDGFAIVLSHVRKNAQYPFYNSRDSKNSLDKHLIVILLLIVICTGGIILAYR